MNKQIPLWSDTLGDYETFYNGLNDAFAKGEISQAAYVEGLKESYEGIFETLSALNELDDEMLHYYEDTLSAASDELATYTDHLEHLTSVLDHYKNIVELVNGEYDYDRIGTILEGQADTLNSELQGVKSNYEMMLKEKQAIEQAYNNATAEEREVYEAELKAITAALDEAQEEMLSKTEEWAEAMKAIMENTIAAAGKELEDAFKEYYKTTYTYDKVLAEMKKIYDNDFYALTVINVLVYTDYDQNGTADEYELNEEKEQKLWTELQEAKAKELLEKIYAAAPATGEDGLYKQLAAVVKEYSEATYNDPTWGTYKKFGLVAKAEAAADYNNTSSLVPEFLEKLSEVYKEIEKAGKAGTTFDTPYQVAGSFPTVYGYHKIAISGTKDRTYATKDPDKSLGYEELRDSQLSLLTENVYKLYLEMQEETFKDEKEEILEELGFAKDYELSDELTAAIKAYYVPAVAALEDSNLIDLGFTYIRETAVNTGLYVFTNSADKEYYLEIEALVRADLQKAIEEAEK